MPRLLRHCAERNPVAQSGQAKDLRPLSSDGGALTVAGLSAARLALRRQVGLDGVTPIGVVPRFLLVSPELETTAEQVLAEL
ncbi:MAG TPA: hypothetical protein VGA45_11995, partial [Actinomycetota bacterium]